MPSSLTRFLSRALVSSTILPVSVLVRSPVPLARRFSWQHGVSQSGLSEDSPSCHLSGLPWRICQPEPPTGFGHHFHPMADLASCVPPLLRRGTGGTGILNPLSITYAFRPWLRGRLTLGGRTFPRKSQDYGGPNFHRTFRYSCPHNHFHSVHGRLPSRFIPVWNAPLPFVLRRIRGFGSRF